MIAWKREGSAESDTRSAAPPHPAVPPFDLGEPIYAGIFEHTRFDGLERAFATPLVAPSIECEIAFRMETDLPAEAAKDEGAVLAALGEAYAACEVVDSRYGVPPAMIGVPVLLADDFLHAAFVLGKPLKAHLDDLRHPSARLEIGGRVHEAPVPEALPPLSAVSWLARKLGENGARLRAGEIVMTGSLLEPVSIAYRGQEISIAIRGVGVLRSSPAVPGST